MICMILYDTLIYPGSPAKIDYILVYNRIIHNTRASPVDCSLLVSHNHNREKEVLQRQAKNMEFHGASTASAASLLSFSSCSSLSPGFTSGSVFFPSFFSSHSLSPPLLSPPR